MRLSFETLERRNLCTVSGWQNQIDPVDVDHSGYVSALDALMVINDLNRDGIRSLGELPTEYKGPSIDVSGNGSVEPFDLLLVINSLNSLPKVGSPAPSVSLLNQDGQLVELNSFIGQSPVVLYFYPKNNTPACTIEASDFRDRADEIAALGAKVFGVSLDGVDSHKSFSKQLNLNFDILADTTKEVSTKFGVLSQVGTTPVAKRTTFIIGIDGTIQAVFTDVNVHVHGDQVVAALRAGVGR